MNSSDVIILVNNFNFSIKPNKCLNASIIFENNGFTISYSKNYDYLTEVGIRGGHFSIDMLIKFPYINSNSGVTDQLENLSIVKSNTTTEVVFGSALGTVTSSNVINNTVLIANLQTNVPTFVFKIQNINLPFTSNLKYVEIIHVSNNSEFPIESSDLLTIDYSTYKFINSFSFTPLVTTNQSVTNSKITINYSDYLPKNAAVVFKFPKKDDRFYFGLDNISTNIPFEKVEEIEFSSIIMILSNNYIHSNVDSALKVINIEILNLKLPMTTAVNDSFEIDIYNSNNDLLYRSVNEVKFQATVNTLFIENFLTLPEIDTLNIGMFKVNFLFSAPAGSTLSLGFHSNVIFNYTSNSTPKACGRVYSDFGNYVGLGSYYQDKMILINNLINNNSSTDSYYNSICNITSNTVKITLNSNMNAGNFMIIFLRFTNPRTIGSTNSNVAFNVINNFSESLFNNTLKMPLFPKHAPIFQINSSNQTTGFETSVSIFMANLNQLNSNDLITIEIPISNGNGISVNTTLITSSTFRLFSYSMTETLENNKRKFTINNSSKTQVTCKISVGSSISFNSVKITLQQAISRNFALELFLPSGLTNLRILNENGDINQFFEIKISSLIPFGYSKSDQIILVHNNYRSILTSLYGENTPAFNDYIKQIPVIQSILSVNNFVTKFLSPIVVYELVLSDLTTSFGYFNNNLDTERKHADYQFTIRPTIRILNTDIVKITFPKDIMLLPKNTVDDKFSHLSALMILSDTLKVPMSLTHQIDLNVLSIYINFGTNFNPQVYQDLLSKTTSSQFDYNDLIRINVSGLINPISFKETGGISLEILNDSKFSIASTPKLITTKMTVANKFRYASISKSIQNNSDYMKIEILPFNNNMQLDNYKIEGISQVEMNITYPEDLLSENLKCYVEVNKTNSSLPANMTLHLDKFLEVKCTVNQQLRIINLVIDKELYYGNNSNTNVEDRILNVVLNGLKVTLEEINNPELITGNFLVEINLKENEIVYKMENSDGINLKYSFNCNTNCSACKTRTGKCTKCFNDSDKKILFNGECLSSCPNFTVLNPNLNICIDCNPNCLTCSLSNKDKCLTCKAGDYMTDIFSCEKDCPNGYYKNTTKMTCSPCTSPCIKCSNENICTDCNPNISVLYNNVCLLNCPSGTFLYNEDKSDIIKLNSKCDNCSINCRTCSGNRDHCTSCDSFNILFKNNCFNNCPNGHVYRQDTHSCEKCPDNCLSCSIEKEDNSTKLKCLKCNDNFFLKNGICITEITSCPEKSFINRSTNECNPCSKNCKSCINDNICTTCESGFLNNSKCTDECPTKFFNNPNSNSCSKCDDSCLTCSLRSNNCTTCFGSMILFENSCISQCPLGFYKYISFSRNLNSNLVDIKFKYKRNMQYAIQCLKCPENCEKCYISTKNNSNNSISCESCVNNFYLTPDLTCNAICPDGYSNDDKGLCVLSNEKKPSVDLSIEVILPISKFAFAGLSLVVLLIFSILKFKYDELNFSGSMTFWLYLISISDHIFISFMIYLTGFTDLFIIAGSIYVIKIFINNVYLCILDLHYQKSDEKYNKTLKTNLFIVLIFQIYGFIIDFKIYKNFLNNYKKTRILSIKIDKVASFEKINKLLSIIELFVYDILIIGFEVYYLIKFKDISSHLWLLILENLFVLSFSSSMKIIDLIINHEANRSYFSQKRIKEVSKRVKEIPDDDNEKELEEKEDNDVTLRLKQQEKKDHQRNETLDQNQGENNNSEENNNTNTNIIKKFKETSAGVFEEKDEFIKNLVKSENIAKNDTKDNFADRIGGKTYQPRNNNLNQGNKFGITNFNDKVNYGSNNSENRNNSNFNSVNESSNDGGNHNIPKSHSKDNNN